MFTFILNSSNGRHAVIAVAHKVDEETLQKIANQVKDRFGLTYDPITGKISDPEIILSISDVPLLK